MDTLLFLFCKNKKLLEKKIFLYLFFFEKLGLNFSKVSRSMQKSLKFFVIKQRLLFIFEE